jgi:hypothetical protein
VNTHNYWQIIDKLMYLTNMRLDIVLIVKLVVSHYMNEPQQIHLNATWHIICSKRYIQFHVPYQEGGDNTIKRYINVDWADDIRDWRFMSKFLFHLGNGPIKWSSKCKQWIVVVSSIEVKYNSLIEETKKRHFVEFTFE